GMLAGMAQHEIVDEELDVRDPARVLLEIEAGRAALRQLGPHARAHAYHLVLELRAVDVARQDLAPLGLERVANRLRSRQSAAPEQRLMLEHPGLLALVAPEVLEARDHQARPPVGAEPRVDLVQPARARLDRQEVDQALHEPR